MTNPRATHVETCSDAEDFERSLSEKHRTPKGVEQYGVESVPVVKRTTGFWDLFGIQMSFQINNLTITIPALAVVAGLSVGAAVFAQVLGAALVFIGYSLLATIGAKYGVPGQVASRMAFGPIGAKLIVSVMRSIVSAYWFAWQTIAAALGLQVIIRAWTGSDVNLVFLSTVFAVLQAAVALTGWESLKWLTRTILPLKIIILGVVLISFLTSAAPEFSSTNIWGKGSWDWVLIATFASTTAAGHLSMYTDSADLARYARTTHIAGWSFWPAAVVSATFCGFIGAIAAAAAGEQNWFVAAAEVHPYAWMYILLLIVLVADNWFINIMNLYTGGFAIVNVFSRIGRFWSTVICATAGILLSTWPAVYNNTPAIVTEIGYAFAPVGGILLAHYVVLSGMQLSLPDLYHSREGLYRYTFGVNPIAVLVAVAVYLVAHAQILPPASFAELLIVLIAGGLYVIGMRIAARASGAIAESFDTSKFVSDRDLLAYEKQESKPTIERVGR